MKKFTKDSKGFTIIEVLIVLAIAGLIMLVVFLAVPALQRNQRNSGYRQEANRILAAAQEVSANNNGNVLVAANAATVLASANAKNVTAVTIEVVPAAATTAASVAATTPATLTTATLVTGAKCDQVSQDKVYKGTTRQTVLMYAVENNAGAVVPQCQES